MIEFPVNIEIEVTEKHLEAAQKAIFENELALISESCVVAQAVKERFPTLRPSVGYDSFALYDSGHRRPFYYCGQPIRDIPSLANNSNTLDHSYAIKAMLPRVLKFGPNPKG